MQEYDKAAPAPKKRVAYALGDYLESGEIMYYCHEHATNFIKVGKTKIQLFRTREEAEFANDILSANYPNHSEYAIIETKF